MKQKNQRNKGSILFAFLETADLIWFLTQIRGKKKARKKLLKKTVEEWMSSKFLFNSLIYDYQLYLPNNTFK